MLVLVIVIEDLTPRARARARLRCWGAGRSEERFIQPRFATLRSIPMNNAALSGLIDRGDHRMHLFGLGFCSCDRNAFLHFAQTRQDTAVAKRADGRLTGAFGSRFRVGHGKENCERGGSRRAVTVSRRDRASRTTRCARSEVARRSSRFCAQAGRAFQREFRVRPPARQAQPLAVPG